MRVKHPGRLAALLVPLLLTATACGGKSKDDSAKDSTAKATAPIAATSSVAQSAAGSASSNVASSVAASGAAGGPAGCDEAELEVKAATAAGGYVTGVQVIGGCTQVSLKTSLERGADGAAAATGICEIAAAAAYEKGVGAVSVESADGKELAIGIKGSPCIGQP